VLWQGSATIAGAKEAVSAFRRHGKRVFFVVRCVPSVSRWCRSVSVLPAWRHRWSSWLQTNNSTKTRAVCAQNLHHHGIDAEEHEVVSSGYVLAHYLVETGLVPGDKVYMIGEVSNGVGTPVPVPSTPWHVC
jgi:ribonucleotide monophosphatase NagD (HAD superfamily)